MTTDFLRRRVCLVTGGAQGIGWAISLALADHGARVYTCDISRENLARAAQELAAFAWSDRIDLAQCDVSQRAQVEEWINSIYLETGRIDVLVNNAAFVSWANVIDMPVEDAERIMRVGYDGMIYCLKSVLPYMLTAQRGHIVNIGSAAGRVYAGRASAAYTAAKSAIDGYTQVLQAELKHTPIKVTLVRPGTVAGTDFFRKRVPSSRMPRMADFLPYLTPLQVADAVISAIRHYRPIVNLPRFLSLFYLLYAIAPGFLRWLVTSGHGRRDYGQIDWRYQQKDR